MDGSHYERKLVNILDAKGYIVIRSPASGAVTDRALPDVLWAGIDETPCAGELKATQANVAYYTKSEVAALESVAEAFGAHAYLIARFKGDTTYYCTEPTNARRTETERYAVDRDNTIDRWIDP